MVLNKEEKFNEALLKIRECPQSKYVRECFATTIWDVTLIMHGVKLFKFRFQISNLLIKVWKNFVL